MPLLDHFRPPLATRRHWHAFHNAWATFLASDLNRLLPVGFFAEPNVQFGIEIDVAAFDERQDHDPAFAVEGWTPPAPVATIPLALVADVVEVAVFHAEEGPILAGAIDLVSPANKDRPAQRDAFTTKAAAYIQQGIGLIVVDLVTSRGGNLRNALLDRLAAAPVGPMEADLYAVAYRPGEHNGGPGLDLWTEPLALGGVLPTLPLGLKGGPCLPVDLAASYERTCREQRIVAG